MSDVLMKSISGIRGVVGTTLTPELIIHVGNAFARYVKKGRVVVGRDSRCTGDAVSCGLISSLSLAGCDVIDLGIVPTPTVQVMVEELKAAGGIVVSASHNPIQWNAFKLVSSTGLFLNEKEIKKFFSIMDTTSPVLMKWDKVGRIEKNTSASDVHINKILEVINVPLIRKNRFKVVLDSVNGAGSLITQQLLTALGCIIIPLHCELTGTFPRGAEPVPENLGDLARETARKKANIGFAQDPDADRLAIVDENGRPIGEEYTLALVTEHLLSRDPGRVVINLSTTKAIEEIAARYGQTVKRTKVGEINVADEMKRKGARIGGEGNGGVISPEIHLGRDSLAGIAYVLEMMAERKKSLSELVSSLPQYVMKKGKIDLSGKKDNQKLIDEIAQKYSKEKISLEDGLRIDFRTSSDFKGGWVHLRPSNTEPIFRIISEGTSREHSDLIYNHFYKLLLK